MNIAQIATYFRQLCDEPNKTFLTDTDVSRYLQTAYEQFREYATQSDPKTYAERLTIGINLSGVNTLDLTANPIVPGGASAILGNTAWTNNRAMLRLLDVMNVDNNTGLVSVIFQGAGSYNELYVPDLNKAPSYFLNGTTLYFSNPISGRLDIEYIRQADLTTFSNLAATTYIDNLVPYHDIIAILAYRSYAMRDGALAPAVEAQLGLRLNDLKEYVQTGRQRRGNNHVVVEDTDFYYY
jgi:hypothetical protein